MAQEISTTEFKAKSQSREQSAFKPKFDELLTAWEQKFKGNAMVCDAEDQKELEASYEGESKNKKYVIADSIGTWLKNKGYGKGNYADARKLVKFKRGLISIGFEDKLIPAKKVQVAVAKQVK